MKEFRVMARSATIRQGFVKLDKNQVRRRKHLIEAVEDGNGKVVDGLFKVLKPCTFKNNETFSYDGEVNKMLLMEMEDVEEATIKEEVKRKAQAEKFECPHCQKGFVDLKKHIGNMHNDEGNPE